MSVTAWAQDRTVSGTVNGDDGAPLPGVTVLVVNTSAGAVTDINGKFKILIPEGGTSLSFSFVGYKTQQVEIGSQSSIDITLETDAKALEEVVVVGYGTTLKKEFTGATASVGQAQIEKLPVTSTEQVLQGLTSGVFVTSNSGAPGGGISVRVRGQSSINASNSPLYVVDGVVMASGSLNQAGYGGQSGGNLLSGINPQDIESIEVLKDAASTAIYGARAANGVVLVTTKRGKAGKTQINLDMWTGTASAVANYEPLTAQEWVDVRNEQRTNRGLAPLTNAQLGWDGTNNFNYTDAVFRDAIINQYQLSAGGGDNKFSYYLSGSYRDEEGVMLGSEMQRYTGRVNLDYTASDRLKFGTSIGLSREDNNFIENDNNIYGVMGAALLTPSTQAPRNAETGELRDVLPGFGSNAIRIAEQAKRDNVTRKLIANTYASYKIIEGLDAKIDFSYDWTSLTENHYDPVTTARGRSANGLGLFTSGELATSILEPTLRFNKTFGDHKISAVAGATVQNRAQLTSFVEGQGFARPNLEYIASAATITDGSSNRTDYSFQSQFIRANYSFQGKYLASATFRRDGSSRFGKNNRYGNFWAVSAGWNFSEESFMDGVDFITLGKIRGSYGVTGNDRIGNFTYTGAWAGSANYLDRPAARPSRIANNDLKWEETASFDIGLELSMFNDRLTLNTGYYSRVTTDLLYPQNLPYTTGFTSVQTNLGEVKNNGVEIDITGVVMDRGDFRWKATANISFQKNEIVSLPTTEPVGSGFASAIVPGYPIGQFWVVEYLGVDPATGASIFKDINNDGAITAADRQLIGDAQPDMLGGFTNSFSYKGISLDIFFQFVEGVDVYNNTLQFTNNPGSGFGKTSELRDRWKQPGDITHIPAPGRESVDYSLDNTRFVSDGSYMRLRNVTLAYQLPSSLLDKAKLRSVRVYATGQNLLTFTGYNGADPEVSTFGETNTAQGTEFLTFPQAKMITFGINIGL